MVPAEESQEEVQGRGEGKVKGGVEVYRRNRRTGAKGGRILKNEDGGVEVRVLRRREYYEERGGCMSMIFPFSQCFSLSGANKKWR